jgi:peptide/nickel transport system substrate-binding protein
MNRAGEIGKPRRMVRQQEMEVTRGHTLKLLVDPEPTTLVTLTNPADPSMLVSAKVTEGLLTYDFDLNPKPQLATSWSVSADGREYAFKLRRGVKWHDGADFTSQDVVYSILLLKEVHPRGRATFAGVADVEAPDAHTAVIKLARPVPYLIHALAACESPMVPRHVYAGIDIGTNPNGNAPIGTGPFVFKEWHRGSHIVYERNPNYWDRPKPYIDRLVVQFIPDTAARISAIETGSIDLAPATPVPLREMDRLRSLPNLRFETNGYQYTNQVVRIEFNLDSPYFRDVKVRRAIAHAIDRNAVLKTAWYGYGELALGPISPALRRFHVEDLPSYCFDPQRAEQLLDEAGYPRGADSIRFRLNHDFIPAGEGYQYTAECVKHALARVGIEITVRSQDFPTYIRRIYTDREFDFATNRANNMFDPSAGVQRLFWSKNFRRGVPFSNGSNYANREVDGLLESAAVEPDPAKRFEYFARFQNIVVQDLPDLTLLAPGQITIYDRKVFDHTISADGVCGNLADTYIER